ncbi:MAG: hypothetical protein H8E76_04360 [Helicobacteraceae bacterium]|nr:hypothetical protein [Candidatus Sulfurimonas ponti]MBL6973102.1 hypothetical protein [Sulfurimonas sp.]
MKLFRGVLFKDKNSLHEDILSSDDAITVKARSTIQKFCRLGSSRPRKTLYNFLEKELNVKLSGPSFDVLGQKEHPRFECTDKNEFCKETYKVIMELKAKESITGQRKI